MTKRKEVIKKIEKAAKAKGFEFVEKREGGNHTIYDLDGVMVPIARHNEIDRPETIYRECEDKLGKGWWR